jgi:hypothetical protein
MDKNIIFKFATIFAKRAQVLPLGTSSLSVNDIQQKMKHFKDAIESLLPRTEPKPGWSHPGITALSVIDKILAGHLLDSNETQAAINDVNNNFRALDVEEFAKYLNSYLNYI